MKWTSTAPADIDLDALNRWLWRRRHLRRLSDWAFVLAWTVCVAVVLIGVWR